MTEPIETSARRSFSPVVFGLLLIGVCLLSAVVLTNNIETTTYHGDESGWITAGYHYINLVRSRSLDWEAWKCPTCGDWGSILTMPLGKFMIGAALMANPKTAQQSFYGFYYWNESLEANQAAGRIPALDILSSARQSSAVVGVLTCALIFAIGYFCYNWFVGLFASVMLITSQLFVEYATRAMTDVHYNAFLVAACLASISLITAGFGRRHVAISALVGILAGLATSVKESGLLLVAVYYVALIAYRYGLAKAPLKQAFLQIVAFGLTALLTIYAINPYFWPSAAQFSAQSLVEEIGDLSRSALSGSLTDLPTREEIPQLYNLGNLARFPRVVVSRGNYMVGELAEANWGGSRLAGIHRMLFGELSHFPLHWLLLGIGLVSAIWSVLRAGKHQEVTTKAAPLLWFLANYLFVVVFMLLPRNRYLIPFLSASAVLAAGGVYFIMDAAKTVLIERFRRVPASAGPYQDTLESIEHIACS